ncbi:MAG: hypothetical protein V3S18_06405 [Dehalococcoidia bacterium]
MRHRNRYAAGPACTAAIALVMLAGIYGAAFGAGGRSVSAHGDGTEIAREEAGPFIVGFRILPLQPLVGRLHVTVTIEDTLTGAPVVDARVEMTARPRAAGAAALFSPALNSPAEPRFYDANFEIEDSGLWDFEVVVAHERGGGNLDVPVFIGRRARGGGPGLAGTAIFALVTLALAGGAGWIAWTARRRGRRRGAV